MVNDSENLFAKPNFFCRRQIEFHSPKCWFPEHNTAMGLTACGINSYYACGSHDSGADPLLDYNYKPDLRVEAIRYGFEDCHFYGFDLNMVSVCLEVITVHQLASSDRELQHLVYGSKLSCLLRSRYQRFFQ
jgi:hypothetical protein